MRTTFVLHDDLAHNHCKILGTTGPHHWLHRRSYSRYCCESWV